MPCYISLDVTCLPPSSNYTPKTSNPRKSACESPALPTMDRLSFLPTIKCSDCGVDIEISQLADHVCATTATSEYIANPISSALQAY